MAGIYVHIPFCHAKCAYCDFFSTPRRIDYEAFADAVIAEYDARRHEIQEPVRTVYFGGGTPSSLPHATLRRLVSRFAKLSPEEFTVEVNPEDVDSRLAEILVAEGVDRISMGIQTLDDATLRLIGRRHTAAEALGAVDTLRRAGVANLCLDLIYGLPGQSLDAWKQSLDTIIATGAEHLSCYALSYEPGTRLWAMRKKGTVEEAPQQLSADMYQYLCEAARSRGFDHYEIANFARPAMYSHHNSSYWDLTPYLGLGPGAHSFDGTTRRYNPHSIDSYIANPTTHAVVEPETPDERFNDYVMTALRTSRGIDLSLVARTFAPRYLEHLRRLAPALLADGRLSAPTPYTLRIPEEHWLTADPITIHLMA